MPDMFPSPLKTCTPHSAIETNQAYHIPNQRAPLFAVTQVLFVLVDEAGVILAPHEDDGGVGAEPADLVVPHRPEHNIITITMFSWVRWVTNLQFSKEVMRPVSKHISTTSLLP